MKKKSSICCTRLLYSYSVYHLIPDIFDKPTESIVNNAQNAARLLICFHASFGINFFLFLCPLVALFCGIQFFSVSMEKPTKVRSKNRFYHWNNIYPIFNWMSIYRLANLIKNILFQVFHLVCGSKKNSTAQKNARCVLCVCILHFRFFGSNPWNDHKFCFLVNFVPFSTLKIYFLDLILVSWKFLISI